MTAPDLSFSTIGLLVYFVALIAFTIVILRNREFTWKSLVLLAIGWVPFLVFSGALILTLAAGGGSILGVLLAWLVIAGPIIAIVGLIFLAMKLLTIWRG